MYESAKQRVKTCGHDMFVSESNMLYERRRGQSCMHLWEDCQGSIHEDSKNRIRKEPLAPISQGLKES